MNVEQESLLEAAEAYIRKGYHVGIAKKKVFRTQYLGNTLKDPLPNVAWDGISIILDRDMVCVDFDTACFGFEQFVGREDQWDYPMPPSLKEATHRGWHLFYRLPEGGKYRNRIRWQDDLILGKSEESIDLLVFDDEANTDYGKDKFFGHVLCSPTPGYRRMYPAIDIPYKKELAMAPDWLIKAVSK